MTHANQLLCFFVILRTDGIRIFWQSGIRIALESPTVRAKITHSLTLALEFATERRWDLRQRRNTVQKIPLLEKYWRIFRSKSIELSRSSSTNWRVILAHLSDEHKRGPEFNLLARARPSSQTQRHTSKWAIFIIIAIITIYW